MLMSSILLIRKKRERERNQKYKFSKSKRGCIGVKREKEKIENLKRSDKEKIYY